MKRKKRAEKGFLSLKKQVDEHEKKLDKSIKSGNWGLEDYYKKEIESKKRDLEKKKKIMER